MISFKNVEKNHSSNITTQIVGLYTPHEVKFLPSTNFPNAANGT